MKKSNPLFRFFGDETHYEHLFFLFLTLVMVGIYIVAITSSTALHPVWKLVLFTLIMNVHIALYWVAGWVYQHRRWLGLYIVLQLGLVFSLIMLCRVVGIIFGMYPGLLGLLIGAPLKRFLKALVILSVLLVSALNYILISGMANLGWWLLSMVPVAIFTTLYVFLYIRQAEARERAQKLLADLEVANRQLSDYAAQVEDLTLAAERQRMARELHDTLSQGLAGLILQLEAVDAHLGNQRTERARAILQQSMEKARGTLAEARQVIDDLRRSVEHDLIDQVRQECEHFSSSTGIPCELQMDLVTAIPDEVAEVANKVISEALANIARHAQASRVSLRIASSASGKGMTIEIGDNGIGFEPEAVEAGHYGLLGMRERVRLAGGHLTIDSAKGKGTRLLIDLPFDRAAEPEYMSSEPKSEAGV